MKPLKLIVPLTLALLVGCQKNIQTNEAVRTAVINHLSENKGLQLGSMDIEVTSVTFKDNEADATIAFKPKGGAAANGMQMRYALEKKGGTWVVKKKADSGMGHGAGMPGGMPGGMGGVSGGTAMPEGHPPMGGAKGSAMPGGAMPGGAAMPEGHPPIGAMKGAGGGAAAPKK